MPSPSWLPTQFYSGSSIWRIILHGFSELMGFHFHYIYKTNPAPHYKTKNRKCGKKNIRGKGSLISSNCPEKDGFCLCSPGSCLYRRACHPENGISCSSLAKHKAQNGLPPTPSSPQSCTLRGMPSLLVPNAFSQAYPEAHIG